MPISYTGAGERVGGGGGAQRVRLCGQVFERAARRRCWVSMKVDDQ
jgi:hypothetical protein